MKGSATFHNLRLMILNNNLYTKVMPKLIRWSWNLQQSPGPEVFLPQKFPLPHITSENPSPSLPRISAATTAFGI